MFSGYLDRPDATAERHRRRRLVPHRRPRHAATPTATSRSPGAASEGIRSGGEWIAPVEVEAAVLTHPAVAEVGVVGLPDPRVGRAGVRGDRRARRARPCRRSTSCARTLPRVWSDPSIRGVVVAVDTLPHTDATGQIRRRTLRDALVASRTVGSAG